MTKLSLFLIVGTLGLFLFFWFGSEARERADNEQQMRATISKLEKEIQDRDHEIVLLRNQAIKNEESLLRASQTVGQLKQGTVLSRVKIHESSKASESTCTSDLANNMRELMKRNAYNIDAVKEYCWDTFRYAKAVTECYENDDNPKKLRGCIYEAYSKAPPVSKVDL